MVRLWLLTSLITKTDVGMLENSSPRQIRTELLRQALFNSWPTVFFFFFNCSGVLLSSFIIIFKIFTLNSCLKCTFLKEKQKLSGTKHSYMDSK